MDVPVDLVFVTYHGKNLCHGVVLSFDAVVSAGVVGAGREFVYVEQFIYRCWEQGAKLRSVIGQEGGRAPPERDVAVHQDIGVTFSGEFGCSDSEHVRAAAEAIREKEDVSVSSGRGRQGRKESTLAEIPGLLGKGIGKPGQRTVWREVLRA